MADKNDVMQIRVNSDDKKKFARYCQERGESVSEHLNRYIKECIQKGISSSNLSSNSGCGPDPC